ncbi:uncharacterized protein METZ01_LOCUS154491 [marine metagenome]|uniref:Uncharacterized protein n=1 Tax=marine metagenome TaxID=408172 RepID=A0A382AKX1_9ZZZZ
MTCRIQLIRQLKATSFRDRAARSTTFFPTTGTQIMSLLNGTGVSYGSHQIQGYTFFQRPYSVIPCLNPGLWKHGRHPVLISALRHLSEAAYRERIPQC